MNHIKAPISVQCHNVIGIWGVAYNASAQLTIAGKVVALQSMAQLPQRYCLQI